MQLTFYVEVRPTASRAVLTLSKVASIQLASARFSDELLLSPPGAPVDHLPTDGATQLITQVWVTTTSVDEVVHVRVCRTTVNFLSFVVTSNFQFISCLNLPHLYHYDI